MANQEKRRTDSASIEVNATPEAAYAAVADPKALVRWLPPPSMTGRVLEYDFREGGRYRIALAYEDSVVDAKGKTTDREDVSAGRFVTIEPGRRIVQAGEFETDDPGFGGEMTMTWSFEPTQQGTSVTLTAENVPPAIRKEDHDEGLRASLENLARFLAEGASAGPER
jgi:uncharacterized protein YndB with AHSA1/START domain